MQPFFDDFSRTTLDLQGPPTRDISSQILQKYTFPVYSNKAWTVCFANFSTFFQFTYLKLIVNYCIKHWALCVDNLWILLAIIHVLSWTTKKHQKTLSWPQHSKLKKIQGLFKDLHRNLRAFQDCANPVSVFTLFMSDIIPVCTQGQGGIVSIHINGGVVQM